MSTLLAGLTHRLAARGSPLRALIFDVDGTLADTEEVHRQSFNQAFARHDLPWQWSRADYAKLLRVAGGRERIAHYLNTLTLDTAPRERLRSTIDQIHGTKTALYAQRVARGEVPLRPGVLALLHAARAGGLLLAIATTTTPANVLALLRATLPAGGASWFAAIAAGDCVPVKKPAPDIYLHVLAAMGESAAHCVAFEDCENGLRAARQAGLYTVVTPTVWSQDEDFQRADLVLVGLDQEEVAHAT